MEPLGADDPRQVGGYRLLRRLGAGGMGRVYLGRTGGGRTVAVKVVRSDLADDGEFRARFRQEVAAARRVGGAWTAPVLDADTEGPRPWVATGYVAGPALDAAVRETGPLPEQTVRALGAGLAEALGAVHATGLVHRDVKPSNVLLALDGPRLIDFGIARALDAATALTRSGYVVGSPGYMSPEQAGGHEAGPASDVFSLGAVLAYAATGVPPFGEGVSAAVLLYRVVHERPGLGALDGPLRQVVEACLAKEAAARPTPDALREALAAGGETVRLLRDGWLPAALSAAVGRRAVELLDLEGEAAEQAPAPWDAPGTGTDGSGVSAASGSFGPPPEGWVPTRPLGGGAPPAEATGVPTAVSDAVPDAVPGQRPRAGRWGPGARTAAAVGALLLIGGATALVLRLADGGKETPSGGSGAAATGQVTPAGGSDTATTTGQTTPSGEPSTTETGEETPSGEPSTTATGKQDGQVPAALLGRWSGDITTKLVPLSSTFEVTVRQGAKGAVVTESRNNSQLTKGSYCLGQGTLLSVGPRRIVVREEPSGGNTSCTTTPETQTYTLNDDGTLHLEVADASGTDPSGDLARQG
ncbi:serine/threonine-protein kinase [Peterkaempfera bronchialis]|uniref:Serine/threonine protein kinase n=1 Tax=Peterkaempfera bronchialis TaxID=2126346 RepID=A0A345SZ54_9ACTN|nr:serine/threonine-protein kinase [Peterkaempfera bronchialis]AXI79009.1 serine/threonine protein kinase [Peterkaempfera bronchialis]